MSNECGPALSGLDSVITAGRGTDLQENLENAAATPDAIFCIVAESLPMSGLARSALLGDPVVFSQPLDLSAPLLSSLMLWFMGKVIHEFKGAVLGNGAYAETDYEGPFLNFKGVPLDMRRAARPCALRL